MEQWRPLWSSLTSALVPCIIPKDSLLTDLCTILPPLVLSYMLLLDWAARHLSPSPSLKGPWQPCGVALPQGMSHGYRWHWGQWRVLWLYNLEKQYIVQPLFSWKIFYFFSLFISSLHSTVAFSISIIITIFPYSKGIKKKM